MRTRISIFSLFFRSSPTNIARLIVPVSVRITINRVLWSRHWTNICKKVLKGVEPSVTHSDTTTPIVTKARVVRICCTCFDTCPYAVLSRCSPIYCSTMSLCKLCHYLLLPASTTPGQVTLQGARDYGHLLAAVALTQQKSFSLWRPSCFLQNNQATIAVSDFYGELSTTATFACLFLQRRFPDNAFCSAVTTAKKRTVSLHKPMMREYQPLSEPLTGNYKRVYGSLSHRKNLSFFWWLAPSWLATVRAARFSHYSVE